MKKELKTKGARRFRVKIQRYIYRGRILAPRHLLLLRFRSKPTFPLLRTSIPSSLRFTLGILFLTGSLNGGSKPSGEDGNRA